MDMETLKLIGWEKGLESDFSLVRRVSDLSKITIRVVLHLSTIFSLVDLHEFLSKLTPSDYVLPEHTRVRRQLVYVKAAKKKFQKNGKISEMESYVKKAFFPFSEDPVSPAQVSAQRRRSGPICQCEPELKRLKLQNETLELQKGMECEESMRLSEMLTCEKTKCSELMSQVTELQKEVITLKQQLGGTRSALSKKLNQEASLPTTPVVRECKCSKYDHFICVSETSADNPRLFEGIEFMSGKKQASSGKTSTFVKIPSKAPNSTISNRELSKRASFAMLLIRLVSGCPKVEDDNNNKESELLLSRMIQSNSSLFRTAAERVGLYIFRKLTVLEAVNIRSLLRMPMSLFRALRTTLSNMGINILPSEPKMRTTQRMLTQHVERSIEVESMTLKLVGKDAKLGRVPVLKCIDLVAYSEAVFLDIKNKHSAFDNLDNEIWLLFSGDKGGGLMKFHFEIANCGGSVFDVHMFSMKALIVWKIWQRF